MEREGRRLVDLVRTEAYRTLSESALEPDPALVAEGWTRRFVADAVRADEAVALYEALGFETRQEPIRTEQVSPDCADCALIVHLFRTIYTRPRRGRENLSGTET